MSGQIIPSPELPTGTVTVRVIRQTIMNVAPGIDVELHGAGDVRHATTGPEGRAEFPGLPAGARVHAVAVVDGERLQSIEFDVPAAGGVRTILAAGVGVGEMVRAALRRPRRRRAAPVASAPPAKPGQLAFANDTRFAVEFQDDTLAVFYLLDIVNPSSGPVALGEPLVIDLPAEASGAGLLEGGSPLATVKGRRVTIAGTLPSGVTTVPVAYRIESWGGTWSLSQTFPLPIVDVALVVQKVGGMRLSSPSAPTVRDSQLQGTAFIMGTGASVPAGTPLQLTLSGLPHRSRVPVYVTLAIASGLAVWGAGMAMSQSAASAAALAARRRELEGRRDRGLAALAALERRHVARALERGRLHRGAPIARRGFSSASTASSTTAAVCREAARVSRRDRLRPGHPDRGRSTLRATPGAARRLVRRARWRGRRARGPERGREVHAPVHSLDTRHAHLRRGPLRLAHGSVCRSDAATFDRLARSRSPAVSRADRSREPAVLRATERRCDSRRGRRPRPRVGGSRRPRGRFREQLLSRHAPAARARTGAPARPAARVAR